MMGGPDELPENVDLRLLGTMMVDLKRGLAGVDARLHSVEGKLDALADDLFIVSGMAMHAEGLKRKVDRLSGKVDRIMAELKLDDR